MEIKGRMLTQCFLDQLKFIVTNQLFKTRESKFFPMANGKASADEIFFIYRERLISCFVSLFDKPINKGRLAGTI